ncbi:unnamed protein product [Brassica napus]|uniref:(rape) hypothetical protein n=1 Tax=Brassica napus TaxID=3708 RepID=A0A816XVS7_BRANA|nr:unnamed protein product [Brassica napus]
MLCCRWLFETRLVLNLCIYILALGDLVCGVCLASCVSL